MQGFITRRRVAARLAARDAARHRGRTTVVALLVTLPVLAVTTFLVLSTSEQPVGLALARAHLGDGAQAHISEWSDGPVTQSPTESWSSGVTLNRTARSTDDHEAALRAALPTGDTLVRAVGGPVWVSAPDRGSPVEVDGSELPAQVAAGLSYAAGRAPTAPGEVALRSERLAELDAALGDTVTLAPPGGREVSAVVVGAISDTWRGSALVAPAGTLDETALSSRGGTAIGGPQWWVLGPEPVTWEHVQKVNALGSLVMSRAVLADPPEVADPGAPEPLAVRARMLAPIGAVAVVVLLELVLLIGPAFAVGVRRTERQLALLAAVGGDRRALGRVVRYGGAGIGFGASVIGALVGIGVAATIRVVVRAVADPFAYPDLRVPALALVGVVTVGTAVAVAAAWLPSRRATRVDVVAALTSRRTTPTHRRGAGAVATVATVAGGLAAAWAAVHGSRLLLIAGVSVGVLGLVGLSGPLVGAVALLAPRLGPAGRFAARDADRQRARTAPAVAAVLAATAGMIVAVVVSQTSAIDSERAYTAVVGTGSVVVDFTPAERTPEAREALAEDAASALRDHLPVDEVRPVSVAIIPTTTDTAPWSGRVVTVPPPSNTCPLTTMTLSTDGPPETTTWQDDPRCTASTSASTWSNAWGGMDARSTGALVDDGTAVALMGVSGAQDAAAALRAGRAVVRSPLELAPDGTVRVVVTRDDDDGAHELTAADIPAVALPLGGATPLVLPPVALDRLGLTAEVGGLVATTTRTPSTAELDAAGRALRGLATVTLETGPQHAALGSTFLALVGLAVLVGVGATAVVVALAASDSRPDLAVLAAVGASPRTRRRVAGAQAAVVAGIGSAAGTTAGLTISVLVLTFSGWAGRGWEVLTPWPVVAAIALGVPALAVGGACLLTPSRLPAVPRRVG